MLNAQHATCLQCAQSKVRCDKGIPCGRCKKRGIVCTPQTKKRGRTFTRDESHPWVVDEESDEEGDEYREQAQNAVPLRVPYCDGVAAPAAMVASGAATQGAAEGHAHNVAGAHAVALDKSNNFLVLTSQWLFQEPAPLEENHRAAIAMQSFIQGTLANAQALHVALALCEELHVDGAECVRWCRLPHGEDCGCPHDTFTLDLAQQKLPPFIDSLTSRDNAAAFVYSYHSGHETYATNDAW